MPVTCAINGCESSYEKGNGRQFFHFPLKDVERCKLWIKAADRENWSPTKHSRICNKHFTPSDYLVRPNAYIKRLKLDAVPSLLLPAAARTNVVLHNHVLLPKNEAYGLLNVEEYELKQEPKIIQKPETIQELAVIQEHTQAQEIECGQDEDIQLISVPPKSYCVLPLDSPNPDEKNHTVENFIDTKRQKWKKLELTPRKKTLKAKIKVLQQKVRRQKRKIESMSELLRDLYQKGLVERHNDAFTA